MKNFMVANLTSGRYNSDRIVTLINAQIENSLRLGWSANNIILLTNFDYEFMGIKAINTTLNTSCFTGSKMFGVKFLFDQGLVDDVIWAHDLDAWQNVTFACPEFNDVGIACYSNTKYNGGSIFWRKSSEDIVNHIVRNITENSETKEEPTLNRVLKSQEFKHRVTTINNTFNVGCSGYVKRWDRSIKPIHVCHFHPYNNIAWETHALDRNGVGEIGISEALESLLRKYYPSLATELSENGKIAQEKRKFERQVSPVSIPTL